MKGVIQSIRNSQVLSMVAAVVAGTFLVVSIVNATTTISTDITTDGSLTVGVHSILANASSTEITNSGLAWFGSDVAVTGNTTLTGTLGVSGTATHSGATTLTGTTTEAQSLVLAKTVAPSCIQFYATSTATTVKLTFYATTSIAVANGVGMLVYGYGTCN